MQLHCTKTPGPACPAPTLLPLALVQFTRLAARLQPSSLLLLSVLRLDGLDHLRRQQHAPQVPMQSRAHTTERYQWHIAAVQVDIKNFECRHLRFVLMPGYWRCKLGQLAACRFTGLQVVTLLPTCRIVPYPFTQHPTLNNDADANVEPTTESTVEELVAAASSAMCGTLHRQGTILCNVVHALLLRLAPA